MKDYAKIDTSEKMNKYEMAYYCVTFIIVFISLLGLLFIWIFLATTFTAEEMVQAWLEVFAEQLR